MADLADTFPRQQARTRRFTLGEPRAFTIAPDGARVLFLRSRSGSDPVMCLWSVRPPDGAAGGVLPEQPLVDPRALLSSDDDDLPPAERARRERAREVAGGVTAYATDAAASLAAFALQGRLFVCDTATGRTSEVSTGPAVFDPRPSPDGGRIAYVSERALRIVGVPGATEESEGDRLLAGENDETITWGAAEFVAAEELHRFRGFWWSPDSTTVLAARVDTSPVHVWHIADPANPDRPPTAHRYPAAGTPNAVVTLALFDADTGERRDVQWDNGSFPYLLDVVWPDRGGPVLVVLDRAQQRLRILTLDPATGCTTVRSAVDDPVWVELTPGTPRRLDDGRWLSTVDLVGHADHGPHGTRALTVDGMVVTPMGWQVRRVVDVGADHAVVVLHGEDGTTASVWAVQPPPAAHRLTPDGRFADLAVPLSPLDGVSDAWAAGGLAVVRTATLEDDRARYRLVRFAPDRSAPQTPAGACPWGVDELGEVASHAEVPLVTARPRLLRAGARQLHTAVLLPSDPEVASGARGRLPVLLDPYGGPHHQEVLATRRLHAEPQWLADQGFAVVVIDGRGTPGKGPAWERAVHHDLAGPVLEDQVDGLHAVAAEYPQLDLGRVAIRGWSFGGYLAALAVLRRPDVFHAAIAGAPVTEWRLYDTGYTERYLGDPVADPGPYDRCSLLRDAPKLTRPLLLVHGLADDNVVAAHTLRLSSALLAAGRPHEVLPLSGVTHMTPQEVVAENLLLLQVDFLKRALGLT